VEEAQHCELLDFYFVNIAVSAVCGHGNWLLIVCT
jgi:hypothetical protein